MCKGHPITNGNLGWVFSININSTLSYLELIFTKNHFNPTKIFVLSLFKKAVNQTGLSSNFWCVRCAIYRRMCDVYGEAFWGGGDLEIGL